MQGNESHQFEHPRSTVQADDGIDIGDVESIDSMARGAMNSKCKIHNTEDIKAFCKDDLCSICFKCLLGEHRNHEIVMLDELSVEDLQGKVTQFQDKVEDQIVKLGTMREKVQSIKENYDKKFNDLFT